MPLRFDFFQGFMWMRTEKAFKTGVHLQFGQANDPDMFRNVRCDTRPTAYQQDLMALEGITNFKGPEQMTDPQNMLTVKDDFHR